QEHPAAETIGAFAEGRLRRAEVVALTTHLARCAACREAVEAANEAFAAEAPSQPVRMRPWWIAAAAAAAVIAIVAVLLPLRDGDGTSRLVSLVPADRRLVEPRLTGGFGYAPYRGPMRGGTRDPRMMKLMGAAGDLAERADRERSADAQHVAGVALLLADGGDDGVTRLREAAAKRPDDAATWSDVAAGEYAEALRSGRPSRFPVALAAADRALRIDAKHAEASFNRALILERLGLTQEARAAWERYLAIDGGSPWAAEARQRLGKLPRQTSQSLFQHELPRLESAAAAGDTATVRAVVSAYPQQSRAWAEAEWPAQWAEALRRGDPPAAARALAAARATGEVLASIAGESLVRDAVARIDGDPGFADAYLTYRDGRKAYAAGKPKEAEPLLRTAAERFAAAQSPMGYVARYYAASARFDRNDLAGARGELETLLGELARQPRYAAATAQVEWELALCHMTAGDWNAALPLLSRAESAFARLGERSHAAFVGTLLADTLASLGRPDESWTARVRSFAILSEEGRTMRLAVSLGAASRIDLRVGRLDAARALLRLEQTADRTLANDALLADALLREAVLAAKVGDAAGAAHAAEEASAVAGRITDPELRARALADVDFAAGAVALDGDAGRAKMLLTRAIEAYRTRGLPFYLAESLLLRGRAAKRLGAPDEAARDLAAGIEVVEQSPIVMAGAVSGTGVHDAGDALFEDAIALALDRGATNEAFAYAERARGGAVGAAELVGRLAGSGVVVLEAIALPEEVIVFTVDGERVDVHRTKIAREVVAALVQSNAATRLYDLLVRPSEVVLARNREVVVIADPLLAGIPFAALYDGVRKRYVIESTAVARAERASVLRADRMAAPRQVLAVSLPTGDDVGLDALPDGLAEARELQGLYPRVTELTAERATFPATVALARQSEVVHISGHTERQPGNGDAALVFADGPVTWSAVASAALPDVQVVVLAACETLRAPAGRDARTLSLGAGFLAAGARDVVGTLTPIADVDARMLFHDFHQHLAAGLAPVDALRQAQLHAIAAGSTSWQAVALLTTRITTAG
ncbi:MAG: hypothetical protein QOH21_1595, partial [Acidobacteriota bacterium]|nr:hypothetical protein [Acidobacteriota bacterium]